MNNVFVFRPNPFAQPISNKKLRFRPNAFAQPINNRKRVYTSFPDDRYNYADKLSLQEENNSFNYTSDVKIESRYDRMTHNAMNNTLNAKLYDASANPHINDDINRSNRFENPFKISTDIIDSVNQYKWAFKNTVTDIFDTSVIKEANNSYTAEMTTVDMPSSPSLFNPYFGVHIHGMAENVPLLNRPDGKPDSITLTKQKFGDNNSVTNVSESFNGTSANTDMNDYDDCSIKTLVELSKTKEGLSQIGGAGYTYADFMFCKDLGKVANNHLITLRRFTHPIGDNIYDQRLYSEDKISDTAAPDVARLVTWFNDDNKLEEILKYQYNASWKEFTAKIQEQQSQEDSPDRGIMGSVINLQNPKYRADVGAGRAGSGNKILGAFAGAVNTGVGGRILDNKGTYEGNPALGNYDNNRIYTPKDTIWDTHKYEGQLKFTQEFQLTFEYKLRAYDNINPKSAMLDLLGNIYEVTYKHGRFWGGQQKIVGAQPNRQGWKKAQNFVDQKWDQLGGFLNSLMGGTIDWSSVWGAVSNALGKAQQIAQDTLNKAKDPQKRTEFLKTLKDKGAGTLLKGMMQNALGRPSMYAFDSLLTGEPVGLWHVTLGNPRNPIMVMGNLIMTNAQVQHSGPLGVDDFPDTIKVTVTLKHAKSRDITDIEKMYTKGKSSIYYSLDKKKLEYYYGIQTDLSPVDPNDPKSQKIVTAKNSEQYSQLVLSKFKTDNADQLVFNFAQI